MALQVSKTCKVWIPLNPSMGSLVAVLSISDSVFPPFSLFLNSSKVFSNIFTSIDCGWLSFTIGCLLFYSDTLGFPRYHWFPPFALLGTITNVVSATLVAGPLLIAYYFLLLRFFLQKSLADFLVMGGPRWLTFVLTFSMSSRFHLLAAFPFVIFPKWADSFLSGWKIPSHLPWWFFFFFPSWVLQGTRPLLMNCWFLSLLIHFLHHWVANSDTSVLVPCVSWHAPLNRLNPNLTLLHVPRILGLWESLGILAQFRSWAPNDFSNLLRAGLGFFFPLFLWGPKLANSWIWAPPYGPLTGLELSSFLYWKTKCITFLDFNPLGGFEL